MFCTMQSVNWCCIFVDAYKYSSKYLLFTLTMVVVSIFWVWIYEKPQFYKLIFKKSKHSNILSPIQSNDDLESEDILFDREATAAVQKRLAEISKDKVETEKAAPPKTNSRMTQ